MIYGSVYLGREISIMFLTHPPTAIRSNVVINGYLSVKM